MEKALDPRFALAGEYIRKMENAHFRHIFRTIPKTFVANELGIKPKKFNDLLADPMGLKVGELLQMADLFGCDFFLLTKTVSRQVKAKDVKRDY